MEVIHKLSDTEVKNVVGGTKEQQMLFVYTVRNGETIQKISVKFDVPISEIERLNSAEKLKSLQAGDKILLPIT